MFPESREGPSTAGGKPPRSGVATRLLCEVPAPSIYSANAVLGEKLALPK